ncbi:hypothetical protein ACPEEZ_04700 [Frigoribacterium sp. 2-23]|uniref:hypothetical protein n=1 Tax=Frigoribacterium sp. 2-23 TaxID=3415006 RepID=UPI003C6FD02A
MTTRRVPRMRPASVLGEAWRDLATGTSHAFLFTLVFALLVGSLALVASADVAREVRAARDYQASGASIQTLTYDGRVDGAACEALASLHGVRAAGAIRASADDVVDLALPSSPLSTFDVTESFRDLLSITAQEATPGVLLADSLADDLDAHPGSRLTTTAGVAPIAATFSFPDDGRRGDLGSALLVPQSAVTTLPYDQCWVDVWPQNDEVLRLLRTTVTSMDGQDTPVVLPLNSRLGSTFVARGDDILTIGRAAAVGGSFVGFSLGYLAVRLRRLELAAARHVGVPLGAQAFGQLAQASTWTVVGALVAVLPVVWSGVDVGPPDAAAIAVPGIAVVVSAGVTVLAGVALGLVTTRERHLFRYFKER